MYGSVAVWLETGADPPFGDLIGFMYHETSADGAFFQLKDEYPLVLPQDYIAASKAGDEDWIQFTVPMQQVAHRYNQYRVRLYGAAHEGWIGTPPPPALIVGEVEMRRWANVSSRQGWDIATFPAALYDYLIEHWLTDWDRDVTATGETFTSNIVERLSDHADARSLLDGLVKWGDWYVRLGEKTLVWEPRKGGHKAITFTKEKLKDFRISVDGADAATRVVALADSSDGPNREEGYAARVGEYVGAELHAVIDAQPTTKVRDLDILEAGRHLELYGGSLITVEGSPPNGTILLQDGSGYELVVGDSADFDVEYGYVTMEFTAKLAELVVDPMNDSIETTWITREEIV
jgi:hypothetical protein